MKKWYIRDGSYELIPVVIIIIITFYGRFLFFVILLPLFIVT